MEKLSDKDYIIAALTARIADLMTMTSGRLYRDHLEQYGQLWQEELNQLREIRALLTKDN